MTEPDRRWQFGPPLDCFDRGFQFGDGVFETIEHGPKGAWLLEQHRNRLWQAARALGLRWPTGVETRRLLAAVEARAKSLPRAVVKLYFSAAPTQRGYRRPWPHPGLLRASVSAVAPAVAEPAVVEVLDQVLDGAGITGGLKHLNRLPQVLLSSVSDAARSGASSACDERLVCNRTGSVEEGTYSNFFYQLEGRIYTPPIQSGVAGTLRAALLDAHELALIQRPLALSELPQLERCWIGNSVFGLRPVQVLSYRETRLCFEASTAADSLLDWVAASRDRDCESLLTLSAGPTGDPGGSRSEAS